MTTVSVKRHLRELQWRLMLVAAFFIIGASLAYTYQSTLVPLLLNPLGGEKLVYLNPAGGFSFIFMISIYAGIALAFPLLLQQVYSFLKPALPKAAQRKSSVIIISSLVLLVAGILFGYLVAVPNALNFLYSFADQYVEASLTAESYLNFIIAYTIGIGIVFQLPLLLLLLHAIKPLKPGGLLKSEKWVVLVAFIIAAIITPTPDPVNQAIIAGPVVIVYQIGVIAVLINIANKKRATKRQLREHSVAQQLLEKTKEELRVASPAPLPSPVTASASPKEEPKSHHQKVQIQPQLQRTMDGVIARRPAPQLRVPQRQNTQPVATPTRAQPITKQTPQKGFYVDGIITPRQATSF